MRDILRFLGWPTLGGILAGLLILTYVEPSALGGLFSHSHVARDSYADAVGLAAPAVVNIYTSKTVRSQSAPLLDDPLARRFFNRGDSQQQQRIQRSLGSGVIIDRDGYILTNHHVISGADEIVVLLADGREALARVVGFDAETDLAALKIDLPNLEPITIGDATRARVGDVVLAIGNPYGFGQSVSQGIISATGRYGLRLATYEDFIQTDAAINPGNSGGALIDVDGKLLGINTAIYSQTGSSSGIGLAIPVDIAVRTMRDLIEFGHPMRGWIGIEVQRLPTAYAQVNHLNPGNGVVITGVYRDGPGAEAGLRPGDILLAINGQAVGDGHVGLNLLAATRPGDRVALIVVRNGQQLQLKMMVGTRPAVSETQN
ncbi:MAG TPA: trypsin-like peptidase domain-containing protein [Spongiibacteraceae bacterium]|nr:trypsin-like peptidase domain-containing protein [Spongiibacteraceae bacterium]